MDLKNFEEVFLRKGKKLVFPLEDRKVLEELECGEPVLISGWILCGRDATHRKIMEEMEKGTFSFDFNGQAIYYVGPSPAPPGRVIGSAGPTTSYRMDKYMPFFLKLGLSATIGKGKRKKETIEEMKKYRAVYLATFGGAGAFLSECIKKVEVIAWEELGPEAFFRMKVENFPAVVINPVSGEDYYDKVCSNSLL